LPQSRPFPSRTILGVDISICRPDDVVRFLVERLIQRQKTLVAFANTNLLMHATRGDPAPAVLKQFLILNDGIGVNIASRILHGESFPQNLNGTDLTPKLLQSVPSGTRVFLYGAKPEVVKNAARLIEERLDIVVSGYSDGYSGGGAELRRAINNANPDIVLVALGNPRQEKWMAEHGRYLNAVLIMGVGAWFDFLTGEVPRAPKPVRKLRLEWLFRLLLEPRRLWRRYTVDAAMFLAAVIVSRSRRSQD
jgi:exopolysaccharide biosynthesis WecB/TagA/CpsF family protein